MFTFIIINKILFFLLLTRCAIFLLKNEAGWFDLECEAFLKTICEIDPL